MDYVSVHGVRIPLKRYSINDLAESSSSQKIIQDEKFFIIPCFGNSKYGINPQLTFLMPRELPQWLFDQDGRLHLDKKEEFGFLLKEMPDFQLREMPDSQLPPFMYLHNSARVFFGIYHDPEKGSAYGRAFELTQPSCAKQVLVYAPTLAVEKPRKVLKTLEKHCAYVTAKASYDATSGWFERVCFVLNVGDYLNSDGVIASMTDTTARLIVNKFQRGSDDKLLSRFKSKVETAEDVAKRKALEQSRQERDKYIGRLDALSKHIATVAEVYDLPRCVLPKISSSSDSFDCLIRNPLKQELPGKTFLYTEENVAAVERAVQSDLDTAVLCRQKVKLAVAQAEKVLRKELSQLKRYHISLRYEDDGVGICLMYTPSNRAARADDVISWFYGFGFDSYATRMLNVNPEDLAEEVVAHFRPEIELLLDRIKNIEQLNDVAKAYNSHRGAEPKNPHLLPEKIIFG